jgi:hypothetical protein
VEDTSRPSTLTNAQEGSREEPGNLADNHGMKSDWGYTRLQKTKNIASI